MTEDTADENKGMTVAVPGSLTDFAKALRELIAAARDVGRLIEDGAELYRKRRARSAARNLNTLSFTPERSRRYLEKIARGEGTPADFEAIGQQMAETAGAVEFSIQALQKYRDVLRESCGMAAAADLDEIIYGPAGKQRLRARLLEMAEMGKGEATRPEAIQAADDALRMIEELNRRLVALHDQALPPKRPG